MVVLVEPLATFLVACLVDDCVVFDVEEECDDLFELDLFVVGLPLVLLVVIFLCIIKLNLHMNGMLLNRMRTFADTHHVPIISPATERFLRNYIAKKPIHHAREV